MLQNTIALILLSAQRFLKNEDKQFVLLVEIVYRKIGAFTSFALPKITVKRSNL